MNSNQELACSLKEKAQKALQNPQMHSSESLRALWFEVCAALESGAVRAAVYNPETQTWTVETWIKEMILLGFKLGSLVGFGMEADAGYCDKDTMPPRIFDVSEGVRVVPGGTSVRRGAYIARGVTLMPPSYVNVGAYIDEGSLIDSHALVGSCAQVGKRVHVSAAAQIGGVLEPVVARPVILEDDVFVGGNVGIYEGVLVRRGAVLATGVILNASTTVYDIVHERILQGSSEQPLEIPSRAVVVPGGRLLSRSAFAREHGLTVATPIIIKYRDEKTDKRVILEEALRTWA